MTYQGAKAKYKESLQGRGTDPAELKRRAEERLRLAKQRSYCSACKRRGHWHKDPECPLKGQRRTAAAPSPSGATQQAQVCHTVQSRFLSEEVFLMEEDGCDILGSVQSCFMTAFEETAISELRRVASYRRSARWRLSTRPARSQSPDTSGSNNL